MKLSLKVLDKLLESGTNKDISLAIHLAQYQDEDGQVCGVHYKDVCQHLRMSFSSFYKSLHRLAANGIIKINWHGEDYGWWELRFIDNDYTTMDYKDNPFLNLNHEILHTPDFHQLSKSQKKIILAIIKIMNFRFRHRGEDRNHITLRLETFSRWTGKSKRSVLKMIHELSSIRHYISFSVEGDDVFIPLGRNFNLHERRQGREVDIKSLHAIKFVLKKARNTTTLPLAQQQKAIDDILGLIRQYKIKYFKTISKYILATLEGCGYLSPKYLHSLIRDVRDAIKNE